MVATLTVQSSIDAAGWHVPKGRHASMVCTYRHVPNHASEHATVGMLLPAQTSLALPHTKSMLACAYSPELELDIKRIGHRRHKVSILPATQGQSCLLCRPPCQLLHPDGAILVLHRQAIHTELLVDRLVVQRIGPHLQGVVTGYDLLPHI